MNENYSSRDRLTWFWRNWVRSRLPYLRRTAVATRNNLIKLRNRSDCCGNYGQPGC